MCLRLCLSTVHFRVPCYVFSDYSMSSEEGKEEEWEGVRVGGGREGGKERGREERRNVIEHH